MRNLIKLIVIFFFSFYFISCSMIYKKDISHLKKINLKEISEGNEIWFQNKQIILIFSVNDINDLINDKKKISAENLLKCINEMFSDTMHIDLPNNNFQIKNKCQEELYYISYYLLLKGKVKVLDVKENKYINKINYILIDDFSGKQSYFETNKIIFMRTVITIGE